jgi:hypothetical protein
MEGRDNMEHTPLPWEAKAIQHDEVQISGPDGMALELATVYSLDDAAIVVRAVNNHAKLLAALERYAQGHRTSELAREAIEEAKK